MSGNLKGNMGKGVVVAGLLVVTVCSGVDCADVSLGGIQPPLDPIVGASIESTSGGSQMTWTWTYQGLNPGIRPTSIAVTITREGTNIMPDGMPETISSGTATEHQFTVTDIASGTHYIQFVCTYPPGTVPSTATYGHSDSL